MTNKQIVPIPSGNCYDKGSLQKGVPDLKTLGQEKYRELKGPKERHDSYGISRCHLTNVTNVSCNNKRVTPEGLNKAELKVEAEAARQAPV